LLTLIAFSPTRLAEAGQETQSIIGQVKDESGGILPGVTVTAKSPALQVGEMTSVSDERGEYRLSPLPIGTYSVEYALSGFQTTRIEGLRLSVGFVAKVDQTLKVGTLAETVTVSGAAPVVDVASSAATTQFTRENLELIPTGRNGIVSLLGQAPGVRADFDVGGSNMSVTPTLRAFGQSHQSWTTLEGVLSVPPSDGGAGNYWDYNTFEEAAVQTVGNDAEMPRRGVLLAGIVKSGGNQFHGSGFWGQTSDRFQSENVDDALRAQGFVGANKLKTRWDVSVELGGKIIENKLWFYGSARRRNQEIILPNAFQEDGSPALDIQEQPYYTAKLSYQMSSSHKFIGFYQWMTKHWIRNAGQFVPWESRTDETTIPQIWKIEWQHVHGDSMVIDLQPGWWHYDTFYQGYSPNVATMDIRTLYQGGDAVSHGNNPLNSRKQFNGSISLYRPDLFMGNHEFKGGFTYIASQITRAWDSRSQGTGKTNNLFSGNYQLLFNNGVPFQMATWNYPIFPINLDHYFGSYFKDTWTLSGA